MNTNSRDRKLRLLIARLNKERKQQARKIDILCNDLVEAHREFIKGLSVIGFAADFYESIAGVTDLHELLCISGGLIEEQIPDANVAFFLRRCNNFELHVFETDQPIEMEDRRLENCFTTEVVNNISSSNMTCSLDDMFAMGLQGSPSCLDKVSAFAFPLNDHGSSPGFILIYRSSQKALTDEELQRIGGIAPGLSRAISACRADAYRQRGRGSGEEAAAQTQTGL